MSVGWIFTFYLTEVKHQVYVKRQTQTRTTWATFLSTYLSFTVHYFYAQISSFTQSFIHKNCFWALLSTLFLFWEIFRGNFQLEPDVCRSPYTWSLNSNDKITKGCFTNNKMNFEKQLDWQVLEKKDNCNPLHSSSSLSIRAFFSSGGSRRGARGARSLPPLFFEPNCLHARSKFQ